MAQKKVMSPQIAPFATMCPSTVWCRRGDRTIAPLSRSPKIGCVHLRLPLSIHRDTWVVCGLPEPTSISSTKALCDTGVVLSTLSILVRSGFVADVTITPEGQSRVCCMSVRCFASSEPRTPLLNLGQEDERLLNGQHQLLRGEDGLNPGQHQHKEGKEQACSGGLLHHQGQEHDISGLLHHHQREDQDLAGQRLLQQRLHHHLFSESALPQTQDALDERGPHCGVGGMAQNVTRKQHHHREYMDSTRAPTQGLFQLRAKTGINLPLDLWLVFGHAGFIKKTGQWHLSSAS